MTSLMTLKGEAKSRDLYKAAMQYMLEQFFLSNVHISNIVSDIILIVVGKRQEFVKLIKTMKLLPQGHT